jgi:hypothetical protein
MAKTIFGAVPIVSFRFPCVILVFAILFLSACGSIDHHARHQYVLVRSNPPGAEIYYRGDKVGTTPAFIEVRRQKKAELLVGTNSEKVVAPLDTEYRWEGFWSNLVFLTVAPVGWAIDFATGSAWTFQDPSPVQLRQSKGPFASRTPTLAVAPPLSPSVRTSDEAGALWSKKLPEIFPKAKILSYRQTLPAFAENGYDFDGRPSRDEEYELFAKMKADGVLESELKETDQGVELQGRVRDVYSNSLGKEQILSAVPIEHKAGAPLPWYDRSTKWFHLIPNTAGIEASTDDTTLDSAGTKYTASAVHGKTIWSTLVPFLSAIDLTRLQTPRRESAGRWKFEFVPAIRLSYRRIEFAQLAPVTGYEFEYFQLGAGVGPELGYQSGPHYTYLNFIPMLGYHQLMWAHGDSIRKSRLGAVTQRFEVGYLYFINENLSARIFSKTTTSPTRMWNQAVQDIDPGAPQISTGQDLSAGISVSYTFQSRREMQNWAVTKTR